MTVTTIQRSHSHRARARDAAACTTQGSLLTLTSYTQYYGNPNKTLAREFSLSRAGRLLGARIKCTGAPQTVTLHLWRVDNQSMLTSQAFTIQDGIQALCLDTACSLDASTLYRVSAYCANANVIAILKTPDHPDGAYVTLTSNSMCYITGNNVYPSLTVTWSVGIEPVVCVNQ